MLAWQSFVYRIAVFGLCGYAVYLLYSLFKQGELPIDQERFQEYGQKVHKSLQSYIDASPSKQKPLLGAYNSEDLHSYAYFYRNYTKLLKGRRSTVGVLERYESDELMQWTSWFQGSLAGARAKWTGRGLILLTSTYDLRRTVLQLKTLQFLKCPLEIKVYYTQESAPIPEELHMLKQETGYEAEELSVLLTPHLRDQVSIKLAKPFAAFYSPFAQVIVADSEVVFVADPSMLLDELKGDLGAVFALDRELFPGNYELAKHVLDVLPQPFSEPVLRGYFIEQKSSYQQDSSLVTIDKHVSWLGLIAAGNLMLPPLNKRFRPKFEGEKEAFWMGFEQAQVPFKWEKQAPVAVGHIAALDSKETMAVCGGHTAHFSGDGSTMVWISGGYDRNTGRDQSPQPDYFKNVIDVKAAGKWGANLCQTGEAVDFSPQVREALKFMETNYSDDYMVKYFEQEIHK